MRRIRCAFALALFILIAACGSGGGPLELPVSPPAVQPPTVVQPQPPVVQPPVVGPSTPSNPTTPLPPAGTGTTFDYVAYGNWLSASLAVPGRYYRTADRWDFHLPGRVLGAGGSPTTAPAAATYSGRVAGRNSIDNVASAGRFRMVFDGAKGFAVTWSGAAAKHLLPIANGNIDWALVLNRRRAGDHTWALSAVTGTANGGQGLHGYIYDGGDIVAGSISRVDTGLNWQGYWAGRK